MISNLSTATGNEVVRSNPEFQLEPPQESPFTAVSRSTVTRENESFELVWSDTTSGSGNERAQAILDEILTRAERDVLRFPDSAQVLANYALALLNRGRTEQASEIFERVLAVEPRHFVALANLARIRTGQARFDEAEKLYKALCEANPEDVSPLVNLAYIELRKNDSGSAQLYLKRAIAIDGAAVLPRYLMAIILLQRNLPNESITHLRAAAKADVRAFAVHQALGVAYLMAKDPKRAVVSFKSALALATDKQNAVHSLSYVLFQYRHFDAVTTLLDPYLREAPDDVIAREILAASFLEQSQYPLARRQLQAGLNALSGEGAEISKQKSRMLNNLGVCEDGEGKWQSAAKLFLRSIETYSGFDNIARHNLVRVRLRELKFEEASKILAGCREAEPENHETRELQALTLTLQRKFDEAISALSKEIQSGKATEGSYALLSGIYTDEKREFESGYKIAREGLARFSLSSMLTNNAAYSLLMGGRPREARQLLEAMPHNASSNRLDSPSALAATWGLLYLWEGNIEKGVEQYRLAETLARGVNVPNLPEIVRQKMHLENARAYVRLRQFAKAKIEISRGLNVKNGRDSYREDLASLSDELDSSLKIEDPNTNSGTD
jgi:tetratricopeptide (TPR) repeat protein